MFDKFTDRALKVMEIANEEAKQLNHEYIGTEHILLGLLKEGSGIAVNVLNNHGIERVNVLAKVGKIVRPSKEKVVAGKLPLTLRAKKVIELSTEASRHLEHNYVGTEHLLLGLVNEGESVAADVLGQLGMTAEKVMRGIREQLNAPQLGADVWNVQSKLAADPLMQLGQLAEEFVAAMKADPSLASDPKAVLTWIVKARAMRRTATRTWQDAFAELDLRLKSLEDRRDNIDPPIIMG